MHPRIGGFGGSIFVTRALADIWSLPYIDYYAKLVALPSQGLARDGVHTNILGKGGVRNACVFNDRGLRFGQNNRNLLTLKMLDALRRQAPQESTDGELPRPVRRQAKEFAEKLDSAPFFRWIDLAKSDGPLHKTILCGSRAIEPTYMTKIDVTTHSTIRASAFGMNGRKPRVALVSEDDNGSLSCVRSRVQTIEKRVAPGAYQLWVQPSERSVSKEDRILFLVDSHL